MISNKLTKVIVCGAGTMGSGIAQVCAAAGYGVVLFDVAETVLASAKSGIQKSLQKGVEKGKQTAEESNATFNRITFSGNIQHCTGELVIEAIVEKLEVKTALFNQLAEINSVETLFASNTSSLSISALAETISAPERVAGLHFFNPAALMKLVEVVKGTKTSHAVIADLVAFTKSLGKTPVVCKDVPGFIVNRVARPFYIEALRLAEEGLASFETIDKLMESRGFKLGPFTLMDLIGNDVNYAVSCSVYQQLGEPERLKPSPIQAQKVADGALGRKAGKGYYNY